MRISTFIDDRVERISLYEEVVLEEYESDDREEIDEDDGEDGRQEDTAPILSHSKYHIQ